MLSVRTPSVPCVLLAAGMTLSCLSSPSFALSDPTNAELEALRQAGTNVLVVEYYDPKTKSLLTKQTITDLARPKPGVGASFSFGKQAVASINLWGVFPCQNDRILDEVNFKGRCRDYITHGLERILRSGPVVLCRSFSDQRGQEAKNASCFVLTTYSSIYGVQKIEEFLISGGYALLATDGSGKPLRPDLADDERLAKGFGRGLWSFEHERIRRDQKP